MMSAHEEWVTGRMQAWLANHREFVDEKLRYIAEQNKQAGNEPGEYRDEDAEYLSSELEDYFTRTIIVPLASQVPDPIAYDFIMDCASEVDWVDLALSYLP